MLSVFVLFLAASAVRGGQDFYCNFDDGTTCGFVQDKFTDDFDWTLKTHGTPSVDTGPTGDCSPGGSGYYMYAEASSPRRDMDVARLETSQKFSFDGGNKCLKFMYHMYGKDMGFMDVYVGNDLVWWRGGGSMGNTWHSANIPVLISSGSYKIAFEAYRGYGYRSDIAIDEISLEDCTTAPTPPPPTQAPTPPPPNTPPPPPSGSCGIRPLTRIVGGTDANHGDWPWQALLRYASGSQFCGGALVAPQWVVSASHCVSSLSASDIHIRMGAHKRTSSVGTEQDFKVIKKIMHESYQNPKQYSNDIALLKLEKPVTLDKYTNLVCLPPRAVDIATDSKCWITGWGTLSSGGSQPETLQQAEVPIVSPATCQNSYPNMIDKTMVCAGLKKGGVDACQGDSGGPMVCESNGAFYLHGATSWGYGCAAPDKYGVYARVSHLRDWIDQKIASN
ncbi:CUB and peptidase domain-containing protein 1 [Exaiptasia diaphana]|nr:CUB and peptidase domain-containing protein 1 [Exaiptasia diaphana]